ncbi:hypothetical protein D3C72_703630 [compost metagenome]
MVLRLWAQDFWESQGLLIIRLSFNLFFPNPVRVSTLSGLLFKILFVKVISVVN